MGSGAARTSASARGSSVTVSPPATASRGRLGPPSTVIAPASSHSFRRLREYSGNIRAKAWSKRRPASSSGTAKICLSEFMTGREFTVYSPTLNAPAIRNMRIDRRQLRLLLIAILPMALFGCAGNDEVQTEVQNITEAYEAAQEAVVRGNYRRGIQIFEAIQARYPFSELSRQIQLELMYAYYKGGQREEAIEAAETFMRENPIHARIDYALYIKGLAHYEQGPGVLERLFRK